MVVLAALAPALTANSLDLHGESTRSALWAVALAAVGVGLVAAWVCERRGNALALLAFPLVTFASHVALALTTNGIAATYTGFVTLAVLYCGMTQSSRALAVAITIAVPCWFVGQERTATATFLRLVVILAVWVLAGGALANRAERHRRERSVLLARATTDPLTALSSREALAHLVARDLGATGPASTLMVIDLDGFKGVNDMFGHGAGDELLVETACRLRSCVRPGDVCARLGGDEFAVLLRRTELEEATQIAARLLHELAAPVRLARGQMAVTASIGVVNLDGFVDATSALRDADLAMYDAKSAGRNHVSVFRKEISERRAARLQLEAELRHAVQRQEFELYYQPFVHLHTGEIIGVEALLRWNHPELGVLGPGAFLAAAEEIGLLGALDDWVLHRACVQASSWQPVDGQAAITCAVNLSAPQLLAVDFLDRLQDALARSGLRADLLVLELSERLVLSDAPLIRDRIAEIRRLGVRIAIDDFGTGYSSLAYLRELPVDIMKIDQSFVRPLGTGRQASALVRSIIGIAEALDLAVAVEGVETQAQADALASLGCEVAQGYHFGRPTPAGEVAPLLARGRDSVSAPRP